MNSFYQPAMASLLGLGTTSSSLLGVGIGLYVPFSKRPLACPLAFAAGSLISALAIELAYESAQSLHHQGYDAHSAWAFVSVGFAVGAIIYYSASLFLEKKGAAVRYVTQFREYALARKQADASERIKLLATCDLMRHLPAEQIEEILPRIHGRQLKAGEILFRAGDPGDALYIVGRGKVGAGKRLAGCRGGRRRYCRARQGACVRRNVPAQRRATHRHHPRGRGNGPARNRQGRF
jgi:hypothetical protein